MSSALHCTIHYLIIATGLIIGSTSHLHAQRLPRNAIPQHYDLSLTPDLKTAQFAGSVKIDLILARPANTITLNAAEITFESVTAAVPSASPIAAAVMLAPEKEQATFVFPTKFPAGKVRLTIEYSGTLNGDPRGFYLFRADKRTYASTSFEAIHARRAFPSFDEPTLKATFDIALTVDASDMALSNSPVVSDRPAAPINGLSKHTVRFGTTPKLSTYLVALLVGQFECISGKSDATLIRVCAMPGKAEASRFSLMTAVAILRDYNRYLGIRYPLPKLDMIALPELKSAGLENFGAITYRETSLLIDETSVTLEQKKEVAVTVAHEIAHQWFGDLVTMEWWDNLWLNEGLATWLARKSIAASHPDWHFETDDAVSLDSALSLDSQVSTHAIRTKADTSAEIAEMFDGISYGKAGAMLAMVENYLGDKTFKRGVHNYLDKHLYANAAAEDFWQALAAVSNKPVAEIMASFVDQPGVPLLTFKPVNSGYVEVTQSRFFSDSTTMGPVQSWTLPICFKTGSGPACSLMNSSHQGFKVPPASFLFANAGGRGYYRSSYPAALYQNILVQAEAALTPAERIIMIGDQLALMRSGSATAVDNLNLVAAIRHDPNPAVLGQALNTVAEISDQVATDEDRRALKTWVRQQFEPAYSALGTAPTGTNREPQAKQEMRAILFLALGEANDPGVLREARSLSERYFGDHSSVDPSLAAYALYIAARNGDAELYDKLVALRQTSNDPAVKSNAQFLTTHFTGPPLVTRTLDSLLSEKTGINNRATMLAILLRNRDTQEQTWTYIQQHWDQIQVIAGPRLVAAVGTFCSPESHEQALNFFNTHKVNGADRALKMAGESILACVALRLAQEPGLKKWLGHQ